MIIDFRGHVWLPGFPWMRTYDAETGECIPYVFYISTARHWLGRYTKTGDRFDIDPVTRRLAQTWEVRKVRVELLPEPAPADESLTVGDAP